MNINIEYEELAGFNVFKTEMNDYKLSFLFQGISVNIFLTPQEYKEFKRKVRACKNG